MDELLNDRYQLIEEIGSGGMGSVFLARDTRLDRTVAVKLISREQHADTIVRARMRSEAQLAAQVHHPSVAQVFDFEEAGPAQGAVSFIVMQYVEGHSLAQLLNEQGALPTDQVLSIVQQLAEGLQAAHDAGVVHRDLKPANVMVTPAGQAVLVDFGIAHSATSEPLTVTGTVTGTADYMSPEQVSGRRATSRSDLYALGVVAHHCLTGHSPFRRESPIATAVAHLNDELPPLGPEVPAGVRALVTALTARDPDQRPANAAVVAAQAERIRAADPTEVLDVPSSRPAQLRPTAHRTRNRVAVVAVLAALALLIGSLVFWASGPEDTPTVPGVVGLDVAEATSRLREAGFTPQTALVDLAGETKGEVTNQSPIAGAEAQAKDAVTISVVSGKVDVSANALVGKPYTQAAATLTQSGFKVSRKDVTRDSGPGNVVAVDKTGRLPQGSIIVLSVAVAPVVMPEPQPAAKPVPSTPEKNKPEKPKKPKTSKDNKGKKGKKKKN